MFMNRRDAKRKGRDAMKLVLDEKGNAVLKDGLPVYRYQDGSESPFDAGATLDGYEKKIADLKEERTRHFTKAEQLKNDLNVFKDIDPEAAREALETVSNLKSKEILDANGIKVLKADMVKGFETEKLEIKKVHEKEQNKLVTKLNEKDSIIKNLLVTTQFSNSPHFSGKDQKTIYCPEDAVKIFGDRFKIDEKTLQIFGVDRNGDVMMSQKNHGDPADFEEAISRVIDEHPRKEQILNTHQGGLPARGNLGSGDKKEFVSTADKIAAGLKNEYPQDFSG